MGGQYKKNWKRLTGQKAILASDDGDLTRIIDGDVGGWKRLASGIVSSGVDAGVVLVVTPGNQYIILAAIPDDSSNNYTTGDEDLITLLGIGIFETNQESTIPGLHRLNGVLAEFIALGSSTTIISQAQAVSQGGFTDLFVAGLLENGTITARHFNNGDNTNGLWIVFEKK